SLRLLVGAFAQADARLELNRALHIGKGAIEVALYDNADVVPICRVESLLEEVERPLSVFAGFHVNPHERAVVPGSLENPMHRRDAKLFRDIEAHCSELD